MRIDCIKRILIVGAGTMGRSIAVVFVHEEFEVDLFPERE
jgi:3-hydroxyacyl-CoA dehydrogenase